MKLRLLLLLSLFSFSPASPAGVFRCKDASGATTYSQIPCKAGQHSQNMHHVQGNHDPGMQAACSAAREFSEHVFVRLQAGVPPAQLIADYGGVNYISTPALNIINYTSGFRHQADIQAFKVGALTQSKCRNGGFGRFAASELPVAEPPTGQNPGPSALPTPSRPANGSVPSMPRDPPAADTAKQLDKYLKQLAPQ